jgi:hypothetical protein
MKYKTIYSILIAGLLAISVQVSAAVIPLEATLNEAQANAGAGTGSPGLGEATVCSLDPFCCDVAWDGFCAAEAVELCSPDICLALLPGAGD